MSDPNGDNRLNSDERASWYALAQKVESLRQLIRHKAETWCEPDRTEVDQLICEVQDGANQLYAHEADR